VSLPEPGQATALCCYALHAAHPHKACSGVISYHLAQAFCIIARTAVAAAARSVSACSVAVGSTLCGLCWGWLVPTDKVMPVGLQDVCQLMSILWWEGAQSAELGA